MLMVQLFGLMDSQKNKERTMSMMVHCGGKMATRDEIYNLHIPAPKDRHYPIPYAHIIESVEDVMDGLFGFPLISQEYAVGQIDRQTGVARSMFGLFNYDTGDSKYGLGIGFRGSYYQLLAGAVAGGVNPFVCDNLCFSGDSFVVSRKNTLNGKQDIFDMILKNAHGMVDDYKGMIKEFDELDTIDVSQDRGYEILGLMNAHDVIKTTQYSKALEAWKNPPQPDWEERNMLSLYNAVTEGVKKTSVQDMISDRIKPHQWLKRFVKDNFSASRPTIIEAVLV